MRQRAKEVGYSVEIVYEGLRARGYRGSCETVKAVCAPAAHAGELG